MNAAVLSGVRNWPSSDFFAASVLFDKSNLFCSTDDSNTVSPSLRARLGVQPRRARQHTTERGDPAGAHAAAGRRLQRRVSQPWAHGKSQYGLRDQGWQDKSLRKPMCTPLMAPCRSVATVMYLEQDISNRHLAPQ